VEYIYKPEQWLDDANQSQNGIYRSQRAADQVDSYRIETGANGRGIPEPQPALINAAVFVSARHVEVDRRWLAEMVNDGCHGVTGSYRAVGSSVTPIQVNAPCHEGNRRRYPRPE
jgi:hypothetical protein